MSPMGESFGDDYTIVEVTPDDGSEPQVWLALAKPKQATTLVSAAVPELWSAEVLPTIISERQRITFEEAHLKPGDVRRLTKVAPCQ